MKNSTIFLFVSLLVAAVMFFGCGGEDCETGDCSAPDGDTADGDAVDGDAADGDDPVTDGDVDPGELSLAQTIGLTQYVGKIDPIKGTKEGNVTSYSFDPAQGPVCMRGATFNTGVRDNKSDSLIIFLQGGGACWSAFCLAVTGAPEGVPRIDVLDPELEGNPVADWNVVYLPYCDGSFFLGDAEYDDNIYDQGTRYHYGLANLTGAMEVSKSRFPDPKRIMLAGSSGGAYGLMLGSAMVRHYYPDAELIIMADSGIGIAREGEDEYIQVLLDEFNLNRFFPDDCPDCLRNGHITGVLTYFLDHDDNSRAGMFSSWYDSILANVFLQIPGDQYADSLEAETDRLREVYPDRFRRFIIDGTMHTTLLGDPSGIIGSDIMAVELPPDTLPKLMSGLIIGALDKTEIGDVTFLNWFTALIDNDLDSWVDILEERGPVPDWD